MEIRRIKEQFLKVRGLELSLEKTLITNIKDGFDFLGWNFRKYHTKLIIKPSKKSLDRVTKKLSEIIKANKTIKQENLIYKLNPIINGWCNYHQCSCAKIAFKTLNHRIFNMLWKWAKRRHANKSSQWIKNRYWHTKERREWIFSNGKDVLVRAPDVPIVRHERIKLGMNPYIEEKYFKDKKVNRKQKKKNAYKETVAYKLSLTKMESL